MNEIDIHRLTRPYFLPEPHRTVLDTALALLINDKADGAVKVTRTTGLDGVIQIAVEAFKTD